MSDSSNQSRIPEIVKKYEAELLAQWVEQQLAASSMRRDLIKETELREQSRQFLKSFREAVQNGSMTDITTPDWTPVREILTNFSNSRTRQGFAPMETATFIFSLKQPLFNRLRQDLEQEPLALSDELWNVSILLDALGLFTTEIAQKSRDEIIMRQQQELLDLSTPVVRLWDGILAVPLIGTLDSARTQVVMENLLTEIMQTGSTITIIDITGVPAVDTLVAQHLLKTVAAARLMGADCIISGIRPQIAQTIVHLGVDLADVLTKATLADALALALKRMGLTITRIPRS